MPLSIPLPTDASAPEYDAPPPAVAGSRMLTAIQMAQVVTRPASRVVNIAATRAVVGVLPKYDAPAPATPARGGGR